MLHIRVSLNASQQPLTFPAWTEASRTGQRLTCTLPLAGWILPSLWLPRGATPLTVMMLVWEWEETVRRGTPTPHSAKWESRSQQGREGQASWVGPKWPWTLLDIEQGEAGEDEVTLAAWVPSSLCQRSTRKTLLGSHGPGLSSPSPCGDLDCKAGREEGVLCSGAKSGKI